MEGRENPEARIASARQELKGLEDKRETLLSVIAGLSEEEGK